MSISANARRETPWRANASAVARPIPETLRQRAGVIILDLMTIQLRRITRAGPLPCRFLDLPFAAPVIKAVPRSSEAIFSGFQVEVLISWGLMNSNYRVRSRVVRRFSIQ